MRNPRYKKLIGRRVMVVGNSLPLSHLYARGDTGTIEYISPFSEYPVRVRMDKDFVSTPLGVHEIRYLNWKKVKIDE